MMISVRTEQPMCVDILIEMDLEASGREMMRKKIYPEDIKAEHDLRYNVFERILACDYKSFRIIWRRWPKIGAKFPMYAEMEFSVAYWKKEFGYDLTLDVTRWDKVISGSIFTTTKTYSIDVSQCWGGVISWCIMEIMANVSELAWDDRFIEYMMDRVPMNLVYTVRSKRDDVNTSLISYI